MNMKKFGILMVSAAMMAGMVSCTAQSPKANLATDVDSLAYAFGMANSQGLVPYLVNRVGVDSAYMNDFYRGLNEGVNSTNKKDVAYFAGLQIGQQISRNMIDGINYELFGKDSTQTVSLDNFMAGFMAGIRGDNAVMTMDSARTYMRTMTEVVKARTNEKLYGDNKAAGIKFLEENKTKEGVKTTPSGLQYKVLVEGKGAMPKATDRVKVHYKGTLVDGTEFDSSSKHGKEPATFMANQVIKGWTEALTMMPVGSKWELYIPQELAYGARESGLIKPFSALIFEVELVDIVK